MARFEVLRILSDARVYSELIVKTSVETIYMDLSAGWSSPVCCIVGSVRAVCQPVSGKTGVTQIHLVSTVYRFLAGNCEVLPRHCTYSSTRLQPRLNKSAAASINVADIAHVQQARMEDASITRRSATRANLPQSRYKKKGQSFATQNPVSL